MRVENTSQLSESLCRILLPQGGGGGTNWGGTGLAEVGYFTTLSDGKEGQPRLTIRIPGKRNPPSAPGEAGGEPLKAGKGLLLTIVDGFWVCVGVVPWFCGLVGVFGGGRK